MSFACKVKKILTEEIHSLANNRSSFVKNPDVDFTRNRVLDFETTLNMMLSMESGALNHEILKYFSFRTITPSASAFVQQRNKLRHNTFSELFHHFNAHFDPVLYKDKYSVLACDGSSFTYTRNPSDTDAYFSPNLKSTNGYNQVHLVALYDILSGRYTDAVIQPVRKKNEFLALTTMIDQHQTKCGIPIYIADRGFQAYNVYAHAMERNACFLIRIKEANSYRLLGCDMPDDELYDIDISRILTRSHSKKKRYHPEAEQNYRHICKNVPFDFLPSDVYDEYSMNLRVVRIQLENGAYETLVTNLPRDEFPPQELCVLYHMRWNIETSFCRLKHTIGAVNFHSKKMEGIIHEIWARLILYNFCSIITLHVAAKKKTKKHIYQINYTVAYQACQFFLRTFGSLEPCNIEITIGRYLLPIRPDRNYVRHHRFRVPVSFTYRH